MNHSSDPPGNYSKAPTLQDQGYRNLPRSSSLIPLDAGHPLPLPPNEDITKTVSNTVLWMQVISSVGQEINKLVGSVAEQPLSTHSPESCWISQWDCGTLSSLSRSLALLSDAMYREKAKQGHGTSTSFQPTIPLQSYEILTSYIQSQTTSNSSLPSTEETCQSQQDLPWYRQEPQ
jgi:hypothetical protein